MTARQTYHQLSNISAALNRSTRPKLPPAVGYEGDDEFQRQLNLWQAWIQLEKDDPLVLMDDEPDAYKQRVLFTYKQAVMSLQFWPEMWYSAAEFCFNNGLDSEGSMLLEQGLAANPESPLLAFKQADRIESTTQNDEVTDPGAKERMRRVREPYDKVLDALYALIKKTTSRETEDIQNAENAAESHPNGDGENDDEVHAANITSKRAVLDAQIDVIKQGAAKQVELLSKMISHVWIALMRATRRVQGKGTTPGGGFRAIFGEARKRGKITSDFYVECSRIEWQCYRDVAGAKILERGIKLFPEDGYLPLQYMKHLFDINDVTNARGVFETTVSRLLGHQSAALTTRTKPLFIFLHDYESRFGELAQVQKLEKRMRELFPEDPQLKLFAERHATETFDPIQVFPIISRQQVKPKAIGVVTSAKMDEGAKSPIQKVIDSITTNSPKRSLPDDFDDHQARKIARAESPLRGAAGRRINQQRQPNGQTPAVAAPPPFPLPPPLPPQIHYLLGILPKASTYVDTRFDAAKMVELIRDIHLPPPGSLPPQHHPQPPPQQHHQPQAWPQYQTQPPPIQTQGYMQSPTVGGPQYGGGKKAFTFGDCACG
jgi:cleavage stimulation factor subunit 3